MPSVGFVCAHYYPEFVLPTLKVLDTLRSGTRAANGILVANSDNAGTALRQAVIAEAGSWELIAHDNSGLEFGAYQAGVDRLLATCDPDWILIANDTCNTHSLFSTSCQRHMQRELALRHDFPAAIGTVSSIRRSFALDGMRMHRWIKTNIFAINRLAWQACGRRLYRPELDALVCVTGTMSQFFSPAIDPVMRAHLETWLFRAQPGLHWYAAEPLSDRNAEKMARKARSILQEKYLSALLEASGTEFIDLKDMGRRDRLLQALEIGLTRVRKTHAAGTTRIRSQ